MEETVTSPFSFFHQFPYESFLPWKLHPVPGITKSGTLLASMLSCWRQMYCTCGERRCWIALRDAFAVCTLLPAFSFVQVSRRKLQECATYSFKYNQQDAALYSILYYFQCSTCFGRFLRPSSGAQELYTQHLVRARLAAATASVVGLAQPR
jgi:hypothetical protein